MKFLPVSLSALLLTVTPVLAQNGGYRYSRALPGLDGTWHRVELPPEIFQHVNASMTDIRVLGITQSGDTIEAPYVHKERSEIVQRASAELTLRNRSSRNANYYVTVVMKEATPINQLDLEFDRTNFEWRSTLEGSADEKEWFTLLDDYRILSISNEQAQFTFTRLVFPESKYAYYRIRINAAADPLLRRVTASLHNRKPGRYFKFKPTRLVQSETSQPRQSLIDISFAEPVPITSVTLHVRSSFDYYRQLTISHLVDSFKTDQGWQQRHETLASGAMNSMEEATFASPRVVTDRFTITIQNRNDQPLTIDSVSIRDVAHELIFRTTVPAEYALYYGKDDAGRPGYDIENFLERIPDDPQLVVMGPQTEVFTPGIMEGLFTNRAWLWGLMAVMIAVLGWFTLKMLRSA